MEHYLSLPRWSEYSGFLYLKAVGSKDTLLDGFTYRMRTREFLLKPKLLHSFGPKLWHHHGVMALSCQSRRPSSYCLCLSSGTACSHIIHLYYHDLKTFVRALICIFCTPTLYPILQSQFYGQFKRANGEVAWAGGVRLSPAASAAFPLFAQWDMVTLF